MRILAPALFIAVTTATGLSRADDVPPSPAPTAAAPNAPSPGAAPADADEPAAAAEGEDPAAAFEATMRWQTGDVVVGDKLATLHLGDVFRYLDAEDTERVLTAWGNPPGSKSLGMLFPTGFGPTSEDGWAVVIEYSDEGHVDDDDAADIDYAELLGDMKKDAEDSNAARKEAGFGVVHLVGWAEPPRYDAAAKKLFWAKELDFGGPEHTLNYDIRVLGRKGVLELGVVSSMKQLPLVKQAMPKLLAAVEFNPGMRYADYDSGVDKLAAYGIGALVAGKVAAKVGFFKMALGLLLASKKLIIGGLAAAGLLAKKLLGRKDTAS